MHTNFVGKEILHKTLDFCPARPCTSLTHLFVPDWNSPTIHIYDWSGDEIDQFTAQQMGLHMEDGLRKASDVFNNRISMLLEGRGDKWKIVTFKVTPEYQLIIVN